MWDEPRLVRFLNGLSSFCRHIWFDPRGSGASDWIAPVEGRLIESGVDDMIAVLDDLGCERVVVLGTVGPPALQFAATHPERQRLGAHQPNRPLPAGRRLPRRVLGRGHRGGPRDGPRPVGNRCGGQSFRSQHG